MKIELIHGDCLEKMKDIPDQSVDMILTDPPYGTTACKWDVVIPFEPMWEQLKRIIKPRGAICLFGSEPFSSHLRLSNLKQFKYDWVWNKVTIGGIFQAKKCPLVQHEVISIFSNSKNHPIYFPIKTDLEKIRKTRQYSTSKTMPSPDYSNNNVLCVGKYPKSIIVESNANKKNRFHPTQKPVKLLEYLIKTYTLEGETVLDFTMGSGSTGVACKNLNRNFMGIEKDENYFEIAQERINKIP